MSVWTRVGLGAALVASLLAFGACSASTTDSGGSEPSEPTTTPSQSAAAKNDFIAAADTICAEGNRQVAALRAAGAGATVQQQVDQSRKGIDIYRGVLSRLRALDVPSGDREELTAAYDKLDTVLKTSTDALAAAVRGDVAAAESLAITAQAGLADVNGRMAAYGLVECAKES